MPGPKHSSALIGEFGRRLRVRGLAIRLAAEQPAVISKAIDQVRSMCSTT